jgi:cell wall-associated NlpC family hydrolase
LAKITVRRLDDVLVHYLGLDTAAAQLRTTLQSSGLNPPAWAGAESIARILGLQVTLPQPDQHLETELDQPATRAETAYALDQIYHFSDREPDHIQSIVTALQPIQTNAWQGRILNEAIHFIGTPYIWGGNTEWGPQYPFGQKEPGGFDCSGFVRRVYVLQHYTGAGRLNEVLHGRTTYVMAAVPRSERIYKKRILEPGDVMFFGDGPRSSTSEIDHTGIYVGNNWLINSSGDGVTLTPFAGWLHSSFAWAERPLRVAGLSR